MYPEQSILAANAAAHAGYDHEARDVRVGLHILAELKAVGVLRLRQTASHPMVARHVAEVLDLRGRRSTDPDEHGVVFKRLQDLRSAQFAASLAARSFGTTAVASRSEVLH